MLQGQDLLTKRYNINSRNPGGASFEKVAKASFHLVRFFADVFGAHDAGLQQNGLCL